MNVAALHSTSNLAVLQVTDVCKLYGEKLALDSVSFDVAPSEYVGLLGPNGAGKTTLLEIIEGVLNPSSGRALVFNRAVSDLDPVKRSEMGVALQSFSLPGHLHVKQLVKMLVSIYKVPADELLDDLGLSHLMQQKIGHLSAGQRQRLCVFVALFGPKRLLILDEPTSALDVRSKKATWEVLKKYRERYQASAIIATHDMKEARELCDTIHFIEQGRIVNSRCMKSDVDYIGDEITIKFDKVRELGAGFKKALSVIGARIEDDREHYSVTCRSSLVPSVMAEVFAGKGRESTGDRIEISQLSLEDIYLRSIRDVD